MGVYILLTVVVVDGAQQFIFSGAINATQSRPQFLVIVIMTS